MSAFVPIKDNTSKKSLDEASMFLKNPTLKHDLLPFNGDVQGFSVPVASFAGARRESDLGLQQMSFFNSKDATSPLRHLKQLLGGEGGFDSKERLDSLHQDRKFSNYVQVFNSFYNYKLNSEKKEEAFRNEASRNEASKNEVSRNDASQKNDAS